MTAEKRLLIVATFERTGLELENRITFHLILLQSSNFKNIFFKILFIYPQETETEREREREKETQAEGESGSMQGAQHGTQSWVSGSGLGLKAVLNR